MLEMRKKLGGTTTKLPHVQYAPVPQCHYYISALLLCMAVDGMTETATVASIV